MFIYVVWILGVLWVDINTSLWILRCLGTTESWLLQKFPTHFLLSSSTQDSHHRSVRPSAFTPWIAKDDPFLFHLSSSHPLDGVICISSSLALSSVTLKPLLSLYGLSFNFRISIWFTISIPLYGRGLYSKLRTIGLYSYSCWIFWVSSFSWRCVRCLKSTSPLLHLTQSPVNTVCVKKWPRPYVASHLSTNSVILIANPLASPLLQLNRALSLS